MTRHATLGEFEHLVLLAADGIDEELMIDRAIDRWRVPSQR
jgi:hypothetical protein